MAMATAMAMLPYGKQIMRILAIMAIIAFVASGPLSLLFHQDFATIMVILAIEL